MKRETRLNLWFLIIFIAVSLPGAVILFRKKLKPEARPIFMSDEVERRLPYMAPEPTPLGFRRVVPPRTISYLNELTRERGGEIRMLQTSAAQGQPILSPDRQLQLLAIAHVGGSNVLDLVAWSGPVDAKVFEHAELTFADAQNPVVADIRSVTDISLPQPIIGELMNYGYIAPPKRIAWVEIEMPAKAELSQLRQIVLDRREGGQQIRQTVTIPSRP